MGCSLFHFTFKCFLFQFLLLHNLMLIHSSSHMQPLCHDREISALLQLKHSLIVKQSASRSPLAYPKVASWKSGANYSDCCLWDGVECDPNTGHVISLDLSSSCLYGSLNSNNSLFRLVHLQRLNLADNDFNYSQIPSQIRHLSRLTYLNLSSSQFSGQIPSEVSHLSLLTSLDLSLMYYDLYSSSENYLLELNELSLTILVENLTRLRELNLSGVNISSVVPNLLGKVSSLRSLYLRSCGLHGDFPIGIFKLPNLQDVDVSFNTYLTGYFPDSIGNLQSLTQLKLSDCNFSGSIPSSIGNLTRLSILVLWRNQLIGLIPSSIGNLTGLSILDLESNQLTGPIPSSLGNLTQLNLLYLSYNQLTGPIPSSIGNLTQLNVLCFDGNQLTGPIPSSIGNLIKLHYLLLDNNQLIGPIPPSIGNLILLRVLSLKHNQLTGPIPSSIESMNLIYNSLTGNITNLICNMSSLEVLDLSYNNLNGSLPPCLHGFWVSLSVLDLHRNNLQGSMLENWTKGKRLKIINFSQNQFKGGVPRSLVNCRMLEILDLSSNQVRDTFPSWLGNLPNLKILSLRVNKFHGPIPISKLTYKFPSLQIIDLYQNNFDGKLPLELLGNRKLLRSAYLTYFNVTSESTYDYDWVYIYNYSMSLTNKGINAIYDRVQNSLTAIDLSSNGFVGEIPESIRNFKGLHLLNLSNNILTGHIPPSLGKLTELEALDLSHNKLSGKIPQQLTDLTFLGFFNVSHNHLMGPIPQGKQFDTFENSSFEENSELCGRPLTKKCQNSNASTLPPINTHDSRSLFEFGWRIVLLGYGFGLVVGVTIGHILTSRNRHWLMRTFNMR